MIAAAHPAWIAISISIGVALSAGSFSLFAAMRSRSGAAVTRDKAASILLAIALLLIPLYPISAGIIAARGMAYIGLLQAVLIATAALAIAGVAIGLARGLQRQRGIAAPCA